MNEVQEFVSGEWRIVPDEGAIVCESKRVQLGPQQMELLLLLTSNAGRTVSREEIFATVWGDVTVEPGALARCISELRKSLEDDAREPRYIKTLPKRGYQWVAPLDRPAPSARRPIARVAIASMAAALLLALAAWGWFQSTMSPDDTPVVAVIGFSDPSQHADRAWIGTALAELLSTDLAQARYRVIPGETVARLKRELSIPEADSFAPQTLSRMRAAVGADYVITGRYVSQAKGRELRVDLLIQETESGETLTAVIERGTVDDVLGLIARAGARLRTALGSEKGEPFEFAPHLTRDPEATRAYFEGLTYFRQFDAPAARDRLAFVVERLPNHPFAGIALAETWLALGYRERAVEQAERALAASRELPREEQLWLEARVLEVSRKHDEAIELYSALRVFAPHNTDYALRLARQQIAAGDAERALQTVEALNAGSERHDPRLDLIEARAARRLGDHRRAVTAASRAELLGDESGAGWVVAHSRHARALSLYKLGRTEEAMKSIEAAREAFADLGRLRDEAAANKVLGGWLKNHGDFPRAVEVLHASLDGYRKAGDRLGEASVLPRIADILGETGEFARARESIERALATYREIEDKNGEAGVLNQLGVTFAKHRDYPKAEEAFTQSRERYLEAHNRELAAVGLMNLGKLDLLRARPDEAWTKLREADRELSALDSKFHLATVRFNSAYAALGTGQLAEASNAFESSVDLYRELENPRMLAASLAGLGGSLVEQGEPAKAEPALHESLEIRLKMGEPTRIAETRVALSGCLLAQNRVDEALDFAREAIDGARGRDGELRAMAALVDALVAKRSIPEAQEIVGRAAKHWAEDRLETERDLLFAISAARVRSHLGEAADAIRLLDVVLRETSSRQAWTLYTAAATARCEIEERDSGTRDAGLSCVRELERRARSSTDA